MADEEVENARSMAKRHWFSRYEVVDKAAERRMQACSHHEYQRSIIAVRSNVQAGWGRIVLASLNSV